MRAAAVAAASPGRHPADGAEPQASTEHTNTVYPELTDFLKAQVKWVEYCCFSGAHAVRLSVVNRDAGLHTPPLGDSSSWPARSMAAACPAGCRLPGGGGRGGAAVAGPMAERQGLRRRPVRPHLLGAARQGCGSHGAVSALSTGVKFWTCDGLICLTMHSTREHCQAALRGCAMPKIELDS